MVLSQAGIEIRMEFLHPLAGACQRFIGNILALEPDEFRNGVLQLLAETPQPVSAAEAVVTSMRLTEIVARGGEFYHAWFHRWFGASDCRFVPMPFGAAASFCWNNSQDRLAEWSRGYAIAFEESHRWPTAVRAARLMRDRVGSCWYVDALASDVGASAATLERSFRHVYDLTPQHYHCLLRLRAAAALVRTEPHRCIESVALEVGYKNVKDIYRAFRRAAGLSLGDLRKLSHEQFSMLMNRDLRLPIPGVTPARAVRSKLLHRHAGNCREREADLCCGDRVRSRKLSPRL